MQTPAYYLQNGYEDAGYLPPPLTSTDPYPEYLRGEARRCVEEIRAQQTDCSVTFAFITDIHFYADDENHSVRLERMLNTYRDTASRIKIDCLILGGDYTNEGCKLYKSECFRQLREHLRGLTYYPINGNHDDGTIWDKAYIDAPVSVNHLTHRDLYGLFYDHLPLHGVRTEPGDDILYYSFDDPVHKLRCVMLDTGDIPYIYDENGRLRYHAQWLFAVSQKQLDWLTHRALVFDEPGWKLLLFTHSIADPGKPRQELGTLRKYTTVLTDVFDAYRSGQTLNRDVYDGDFHLRATLDVPPERRGELCGVFVGDYHSDHIWRTATGIPYIVTANAVMYDKSADAPKRTDGDKTELLFDVVTADFGRRQFHVTRVGAGESRTASF